MSIYVPLLGLARTPDVTGNLLPPMGTPRQSIGLTPGTFVVHDA